MQISEIELLRELGLDKIELKTIKPARTRSQYQAIINWLIKSQQFSPSDARQHSSENHAKRYIEIIHHLCEVKSWEMIQVIIHKPIFGVLNTPLPIYEYLLFKQLSRELLTLCEEILVSLKNASCDLSFIRFLKARALSENGETLEESKALFEQVFSQSKEGTEIYCESLSYLGIRQINSGLYQEGVESLEKALAKIDLYNLLKKSQRIRELRTHILENLALYEMNTANFDKAVELLDETVKCREELGLLHKIPHPLAHQGIIMRKLGNYEEAFRFLDKAKNNAKLLESRSSITWINHHLAFVLLNQGKSIEAEELCRSALEGNQEEDNLWGAGDCYEQLGLIDLALSRFENAEEHFMTALRIRQRLGNKHGIASSTLDLALVSWHRKRFLKAIVFLVRGFYLYYRLKILNTQRSRRMLKPAFTWTLGNRKWTM